MIKKYIPQIILAALISIPLAANAQMAAIDQNYGNIKGQHTVSDYDSMLVILKERHNQELYENYTREFITLDDDNIPSSKVSDAVFERRLKMMATEVQLPFNNIVRGYLVRYSQPNYVMKRAMGVGKYYFPMIEEALLRHNLPLELKMVPIIESAMNAKARSSAAAMGLWQFMSYTGKAYGLEINSFVDERCDPVKATDAACRYLKDMFRVYKDWSLVIASYNCGPGNVNKAMRKVPGAKNYWDIWAYLPRETRGYVPAFIAANYAYTFHKTVGIEPAKHHINIAVDTVQIKRLTHFAQIEATLDVPIDLIRELNPQYIRDIVPAVTETYTLVLPQKAASIFHTKYSEIIAKDSVYLAKYLHKDQPLKSVSERKSPNSPRTTYKVRSGDTLGHIAVKYNTSVQKIKQWNNLRSSRISIGQRIKIY